MMIYNWRLGAAAAVIFVTNAAICGYCSGVNMTADGPALLQRSAEPPVAEPVKALIAAVDEAEAAVSNNTIQEKKAELWGNYTKLNRESLPKILEWVARDPKSEAAVTALVWVATNRIITSGSRELKHFGQEAIEQLLADHTTSSDIGRACWLLADGWSGAHPPSIKFLEAVGKNNPDRNLRGQAIFALARMKKDWSENLGYFETVPCTEFADPKTFIEGCNVMARFGNSQEYAREVKMLFEEVMNDYTDVSVPTEHRVRQSRATLGEEAARELFEFTRLASGREAPDIEGQDLEGQTFRLSDYRGKVVLLSFWASWCGPCMQLVDQERPLVTRMAGKPFVMIGVNGDRSMKDALAAVEREKITWRSFCSGPKGANGSIPDAWNIRHWPTLYLLDRRGVIRVKDGSLKYIEKVIDQVLAEAENT